MGARILDNYKDRMVTILITPFMSCSARLPVYTLFAAAFFPPEWAGTVVFAVYALGIVFGIVFAKIFRKIFICWRSRTIRNGIASISFTNFKSYINSYV